MRLIGYNYLQVPVTYALLKDNIETTKQITQTIKRLAKDLSFSEGLTRVPWQKLLQFFI